MGVNCGQGSFPTYIFSFTIANKYLIMCIIVFVCTEHKVSFYIVYSSNVNKEKFSNYVLSFKNSWEEIQGN